MRVVVSTCDTYDYLLPGFAYLFNKYWGEQPCDIIGFRQPPVLPPNFVFHSLGADNAPWTSTRRPWFETMEDEPFVFLLEDYWLHAAVNQTDVARMMTLVQAGAAKGDLSTNTHYFAHTPLKGDLYKATPAACYRTSMQPAIWSMAYFMGLCTPGLSPWDFELQYNDNVAQGDIIGTDHQIFTYSNVILKGEPSRYHLDKLTPDDRKALIAMGYAKLFT